MNERLKKLTGKNRTDYEQVARELIDNADAELFKELIDQDDYLFDFIKQNVSERLERACNKSNYRNLLKLLGIYSPFYDDFITSTLALYSDEDLTDEILEIFENGSEDEKTYCAKYFSHIQDSLALPLLRKYAFSENSLLAQNCAGTLGIFNDRESYNQAVEKLNSPDEFEKFEGVNFLISFGDKTAVKTLIDVMKTSAMSENIAGQIPYLEDLTELIDRDTDSGILVLNNIINGLGEIIPLSSVLDFNLWEVFNLILSGDKNSMTETVLANAKNKFETLTENDEYLFDEDKNTKNEVYEIKKLLDDVKIDFSLIDNELYNDSNFVYTALEVSQNADKIKQLLTGNNQTLVLKASEVLKSLGALDETSRATAFNHLQDDHLKAVLTSL
ncbi:hypothetical protein J6S88_00885 [bacterium]|nr:hypothetical protein [bacterium]